MPSFGYCSEINTLQMRSASSLMFLFFFWGGGGGFVVKSENIRIM